MLVLTLDCRPQQWPQTLGGGKCVCNECVSQKLVSLRRVTTKQRQHNSVPRLLIGLMVSGTSSVSTQRRAPPGAHYRDTDNKHDAITTTQLDFHCGSAELSPAGGHMTIYAWNQPSNCLDFGLSVHTITTQRHHKQTPRCFCSLKYEHTEALNSIFT